MPLTLTFRQSDPRNTSIVDESGSELYRIVTPLAIFGSEITRVNRTDCVDQTIASVRWAFPYTQYTKISLYDKEEIDIEFFMRQPKPHARWLLLHIGHTHMHAKMLARSRQITVRGQTYKWIGLFEVWLCVTHEWTLTDGTSIHSFTISTKRNALPNSTYRSSNGQILRGRKRQLSLISTLTRRTLQTAKCVIR